MKHCLVFLLTTAAWSLVMTSALGFDGKEMLQQILQALDAAPAYRMTLTTTDLDTSHSDSKMMEFVKPKAVHIRAEHQGQIDSEMLSDGDRTYLRIQSTGKFNLAPKDTGNLLVEMAHIVTPMQFILSDATSVKPVGNEDVGGTPASVYTCEADEFGLHNTVKMWISDYDHRLMKMEGDAQGSLKIGSHPEHAPSHNHWVITYDYDPSIKITLPAE